MIKIRWDWYFNNIFKGYRGQSLFIFVLYKGQISQKTKRHEFIHFMQQLELLFIFHWILYALSTIIGLFKYMNYKKAYKNNWFEKEAFAKDKQVNYIINRKPYAWIKYIKN